MLLNDPHANHLTAMNHSSSSSDLRPSRKFMTMVNKMRNIDRKLHLLKSTEGSEKELLDSLLYRADRIESRTKKNIGKCQNIIVRINAPAKVEDTGNNSHHQNASTMYCSVRDSPSSTSLDVPRRTVFGTTSPSARRELLTSRRHQNEEIKDLATCKSRDNKLSHFPDQGFNRIDNLISEALEDLNQSDITPFMSRSRTNSNPRYSKRMPLNKPRRKSVKDHNLRHKMLSVLILLTGLFVIIWMI